jgi:adenylate cyclase
MASQPSTLDNILRQKLVPRQARAEFTSSAIFCATVFFIFGMVSALGYTKGFGALPLIQATFLSFLGISVILAVLARRGWWHPTLPFINSGLQIILLSVILGIAAREKGPEFALTTVLPMLYGLAIAITAFRMNPWLSIFAGVASAGGLFLAYVLVMRPELTPEVLAAHPLLGWPSVLARSIVLLAVGGACAVAAKSLRAQTKQAVEDQGRIHLLERTFGRLVAPEVARQILENEDWMRPARRDAVVMFADLKGFTNYSEGKTPEEVAAFLNRCWSVAADIVERHGGVINKYMGDGFLAIFGVPLELADAEEAAAKTALELQDEMAPILKEENLELCLGLHAGPMIVGGIGSESRCEFTVIGSTVNLASRLESLNRSLATRCLTSEIVAEKIAGTWDMAHHGGQRVKGVSDEVNVFELRGKKDDENNANGRSYSERA